MLQVKELTQSDGKLKELDQRVEWRLRTGHLYSVFRAGRSHGVLLNLSHLRSDSELMALQFVENGPCALLLFHLTSSFITCYPTVHHKDLNSSSKHARLSD